MTRTLLLLATLSAPASSGLPIQIILDGQQVGTMAGVEYRLAAGEIHITTREQVFGCQQDRVFWDRFEGRN